ncbi:MAG: CoA pyrophosphatase [Bacteroidia bacterium]|nr:CoA pyrophosphatase [Bacteroidia bacterium]
MLSDLSRQLRQRLVLPLPGAEAHYKMANVERRVNSSRYKIPDDARKGAVLILFYENEGKICFPLIVRPEYDGVHSGQIALPGGGFEADDETLQNTALREAQEEIGIFKNDVTIIGSLSALYIPPSNFLVHPFVGILTYQPHFVPDETEVAGIIETDLESVMDERLVSEKIIKLSNGMEINTPFFNIQNQTVWGATAMILSEMKSLLYEIGY